AQISNAGPTPRLVPRHALRCPPCDLVDASRTMVEFGYPESRLCEAIFAKGLDRRGHQLSADPLAPRRWIAIELVGFAHPGAVVCRSHLDRGHPSNLAR